MGEINSAQYSSVFPRFLLSLGFHPLGEDAKSCESPWLLVETAFFTPLSVDLGYKHDSQGLQQYGLIAEEVAEVYPELVTKGADGKVESVQYHQLISLLLNEVQRQQQEIAELKARNEEQRAQNAALAARLERLEQGATRTAAAATR